MPNGAEIFSVYATFGGDTKPLERDIARLRSSARGLNNDLKNVGFGGKGFSGFEKQANSASKAASNMFAAFAGGAGVGIAISGISMLTDKIADGTRAIIDYSSRMENTRIGFETLMGGAEKANKHLADLKKFAVETPFEFEGLARMSQRLQGVGVDAQKVIPLIRDIGNIAASTGEISAERLEGINTAIAQMISKTRVSAEEMEQLAERQVPAWQILSEATGKTQSELRKLAEQGKLSSDVMVAALQKIGSTKFAGGMERQSKTFAGAMSSIKDIAYQTGETLFKPIYEEISRFSVKFAQSLQSQEAAAKSDGGKWGLAIGTSIGDAIGRGMASSGAFRRLIELSLTYTREGLTGVLREMSEDFATGLGEGIVKGFREANRMSIADLRKLDDTIGNVIDTVKKVPSVADKLKAATAEKDAKKLSEIYTSLASKVTYFGDQTEVAAATQELFAAGFTNLNTGLARSSILMAQQLDKLKATKEAQDEYNEKIKSLRDELLSLRDTAQFEIAFPKATELDKFENWVKRNAANFAELREEIEATRRILSLKLSIENVDQYIKGVKDVISVNEAFRNTFDRELRGAMDQQTDSFKEKLSSFAESLLSAQNVTIRAIARNAQQINVFPADFADKVSGFVETIKTLDAGMLDSTGARKALADYLSNLGDITLESGDKVRIFTDKSIGELTEKWIVLSGVLKKNQLREGLKGLDEVIENLGLRFKTLSGSIIGVKTPSEALSETLADPALTAAIAERAKSLGMTADALKELLLVTLQHQGQGAPEFFGTEQMNGFFDAFRARIEEFKNRMPSIGESMADSLGSALENISSSLGQSLTNWEEGFSGFFRGIAKSFADMARQIIADMIKMLIYKGLLKIFGSALGGVGGGSAGDFSGTGASGAPGFASGGYTGNRGVNEIAGLVHGKEFVMPFQAVRKFGLGFMESVKNLQMPSMAYAGSNTYNNQRSNVFHINVSGGGGREQNFQTATMIKNEITRALHKEQNRNK